MTGIFTGISPYESLKGVIVTVLASSKDVCGLGYRVKRDDGGTIFGDITTWVLAKHLFLSLPCTKDEKTVDNP